MNQQSRADHPEPSRLEPLSRGSLARVLSDIASVLSSDERSAERLAHALEILGRAVPFGECALVTLQPAEVFSAWPPGTKSEALCKDAVRLLRDVQEAAEGAPRQASRDDRQVAIPLVDQDVHMVGLLLVSRDSPCYDETDLRVLATVAGQLASYVAWLRHRDERARLLARERAARGEVERANRAKDAFLAMLSHELRSPVNAIVGWSDMLLNRNLPADTAERALRAISRNARAQAHLIDDALDVSRIIIGKFLIEKRPIDLDDVVAGSVEAIGPAAAAKQVEIELALPASTVRLTGDPNRLQQVFANLLANAVKFTPEGGTVRVSVTTAHDGVEVAVRDTGIGIDPEVVPRLFEEFYQQDSSTTRRDAGLGLGLAIVRHIVGQHSGTVWAESEGKDRGSTFIVRLPVRGREVALAASGARAGAEKETSAEWQAPRLDGLSILVVDDEAETRELLGTLLGEGGASVTAAESAREASDRVESGAPDVVVADIAMPVTDGLAFMRQLRSQGFTFPAIALSAHGRVEDQAAAIAAGFNVHLTKPVIPDDLVAAISVLVRR